MDKTAKMLMAKALLVGGSVLVVASLVGVSLLGRCEISSEPTTPPATPPESLYSSHSGDGID